MRKGESPTVASKGERWATTNRVVGTVGGPPTVFKKCVSRSGWEGVILTIKKFRKNLSSQNVQYR